MKILRYVQVVSGCETSSHFISLVLVLPASHKRSFLVIAIDPQNSRTPTLKQHFSQQFVIGRTDIHVVMIRQAGQDFAVLRTTGEGYP